MIALIPARGNSKGLPRKNILHFGDKPLIAHTIEAAAKSNVISRIIVSTDSSEIAQVAKDYGAELPFMRPDHLAGDNSKAIDTYLYTIDRLEKDQNIAIPELCVLLPTAPLRNSSDIDNAAEIFYKNNADSVISYTPEAHPIFWHKFIDSTGKFESIFDDNLLNNRQDLRQSFYPNGAIFIFKTTLLHTGKYYSEKSYSYIMPRERSVDIDTIEDFEYAEFLFRKANE